MSDKPQAPPGRTRGGEEIEPQQHDVQSAHYSNGPWGCQPVFLCLCGWESTPANGSWETAGEEFDDHLREARG